MYQIDRYKTDIHQLTHHHKNAHEPLVIGTPVESYAFEQKFHRFSRGAIWLQTRSPFTKRPMCAINMFHRNFFKLGGGVCHFNFKIMNMFLFKTVQKAILLEKLNMIK